MVSCPSQEGLDYTQIMWPASLDFFFYGRSRQVLHVSFVAFFQSNFQSTIFNSTCEGQSVCCWKVCWDASCLSHHLWNWNALLVQHLLHFMSTSPHCLSFFFFSSWLHSMLWALRLWSLSLLSDSVVNLISQTSWQKFSPPERWLV